ncbi:serpin E3 isoform X2 [Engystomops pustulosus]|uniref:serpin E3 isoform X2 n=1 Tax=Engystomops pustulosus TaxID=76066 RepID=UPI003AFAE5FD
MYTSKCPGKGDPQGITSRGRHTTAQSDWFPAVHTYSMSPVLFWFLLYSCCLCQGHCRLYDRLRELNTEFAVKLYQTIVTTENRTNLVISPSSVAASLGLLQFGAQGSTFTQIEKALGYNVYDKTVESFMKMMHNELTNSGQDTSIHLACALFVQAGTPISTQFTEHAIQWANSSLQLTNFSESNRTTHLINQWVNRNTGDTQTLPFISTDGSVVKVPMMHQTADINYGQFETPSFEKFTVVELPYLGNTVSMFVVRPTDRNTPLSSIESNLTSKSIAVWANSMKRTKMDIFLPRFKLECYSDLKRALPGLGVSDLFDPRKADFKGISEQRNLYISQAIHKAEIEVEEGGTRGSGVTGMALLKRSRMPVFKADSPFIFFLRSAASGPVLFIGRVTNPLL